MKAWIIEKTGTISREEGPLVPAELPVAEPGEGEIRIRVTACGMCHTELDEIEGRTPPPKLPVVPGHQIVGIVDSLGKGVTLHREGDRVGVGWIFDSCGGCGQCRAGKENLCPSFRATGRDVNGGYAEYMTVQESSAFPIPESFSDIQSAPLLCAGAVGYRSLKLTGMENGMVLGLTGFGASGHIVLSTAPAVKRGVRAENLAAGGRARQRPKL